MKFCSHCQKNDHDDKECWSTRVDIPKYYEPVPIARSAPVPFLTSLLNSEIVNGRK